jgi:hypothetical protein
MELEINCVNPILGQIGEFALDFAKYHNMQHLVVYWQLSE